MLQKGDEDKEKTHPKDEFFENRKTTHLKKLFLDEDFVELMDLILENTYFNIIQETTRKECDLARISKTFVMNSRN
jgi:hypothetical protein